MTDLSDNYSLVWDQKKRNFVDLVIVGIIARGSHRGQSLSVSGCIEALQAAQRLHPTQLPDKITPDMVWTFLEWQLGEATIPYWLEDNDGPS